MTYRELAARMNELKQKGAMLAFVDGVRAKGDRAMTAEEKDQLDKILADIEALKPELAAAEARNAQLALLEGTTALGSGVVPVAGAVKVGDDRRTLDPTGGFETMGHFAQSVYKAQVTGRVDERLQIMQAAVPGNTMREGGSQEGYAVPTEYLDRIWSAIEDGAENLFDECDVEPTKSNSVTDHLDETTPWNGSGIQVGTRRELQQMQASRLNPPKPRTILLDEVYAFVVAGEELLEDAPRLANRLEVKVPEALAWKLGDLVLYGNGTGEPLGIYNSGALISVAKENAQTADTIVAENIIKMFMRLLPSSVPRAYWRVNSDCLMQLMKLKFDDGRPMWTEDYRESPGGRLLGRPIRFSQHSKTVGDKGDIALMDMKGYRGLRRSEAKRAESIHLYFDFNAKAFRTILRVGGMPHLKAPIEPKNGNNSQSHFVTLDERA